MLTFFTQFPEVVAVLSEKKDGSMKVFPERPEENREQRARFFVGQGIPTERVVGAGLVHKKETVVISDTARVFIPKTDALVTREKDTFLSVTVADCLPIFFYDPVVKIAGIAHAGWRGITGGVVESAIGKMIVCGAEKKNIHVACGPSIQSCHFAIQSDVAHHFAKYKKYIVERNEQTFVDLQGIVVEQLRDCGVRTTNIETSALCTFCENERFFSYRRDKPKDIEAMVAVIGMR